jgi:hypothetical protein
MHRQANPYMFLIEKCHGKRPLTTRDKPEGVCTYMYVLQNMRMECRWGCIITAEERVTI